MIRIGAAFLGSCGRKVATGHKVVGKEFSWRSLSASMSMADFHDQGLIDSQGLTLFDTLHELQETSCTVFADNELFGTYNDKSGKFEYLSYKEFGQKVDECRAVLKHLGVAPYDKIGVISNNRYEWAMIACAAYSLSSTLVPMYEAQLSSDWRYIINDSGANVLFCSKQEIFDRLNREVLPMTSHVHTTLCLDAVHGEVYGYKTVTDEVQNSIATSIAPCKEDLANLIYTSGTTGSPKGVELTHLNMTSNVKGARAMAANPADLVTPSDRSLAFLPWAHSYGQTCELWMGMSSGASAAICRGIPMILEDLQLVRPSILFAVPTLYKKVYDGVQNKMKSGSYVQDTLLRKAIDAGMAKAAFQRGERGPLSVMERIKYSMLDKIVLSKIRDRFGGNLKYGCVAGAACPIEVLKFMDAIGIPVCEGYGLTETSPIITLNVPNNRTIGSVGRPLKDVTVYIVDEDGNQVAEGEEGEICCVGPNIMKGYHNNPDATDEVITLAPDGVSRMFHTGDIGRLDADGWVKVTGRIKEQYKLENGKYVVPTPIENAIGNSRFISQVVLVGANRPHNVALIVPEWPAIRAELQYSDAVSEEEIMMDEKLRQLIDEEIQMSCSQLKKFEVPKEWAFVAPFTAANNMLTPKMSIRRHNVVDAYSDVIAHLYGDEPVVSEAPPDIQSNREAA
ncbi:long-chain-fatty-acid-CoA ligase [Nitzschia inconspicua]|uniref:Long-chain-fatty-acid-CoA ligase n=1 Tax=Nitzschia inconspicua TaxID=303405 RepID=A0A9K3QA79_9STRA|nr:long-chain-fatty-acid-CoA ligase [Nitzschia inconspicua]